MNSHLDGLCRGLSRLVVKGEDKEPTLAGAFCRRFNEHKTPVFLKRARGYSRRVY